MRQAEDENLFVSLINYLLHLSSKVRITSSPLERTERQTSAALLKGKNVGTLQERNPPGPLLYT